MKIDEKAFEAAHAEYFRINDPTLTGDLRRAIEAYEATKASGQPVDCREAFEQWFTDLAKAEWSCQGGVYYDYTGYAQASWTAWQAAWRLLCKN